MPSKARRRSPIRWRCSSRRPIPTPRGCCSPGSCRAEGQTFIVDLSGQYPAQREGQGQGRAPAARLDQDAARGSGRGREDGRRDQGEVRADLQGMNARPGLSSSRAGAHADATSIPPRRMRTSVAYGSRRLRAKSISSTAARLAPSPLLLAVMIVLPMGWLVVYSFADKAGHATLGNFVTLFTDPTFVDPLITTLIIAVSVSAICCAGRGAARLAGGAHRHADPPHGAHPGDGLAGDAALRRRHRLGDAGGAQLGPAEPAVARRSPACRRTRRCSTSTPARPDLRHRLLHLSLCLHPGRQCARPHAGRARGRLLDAGREDLADGAADHRAARPADPAGRRAGRLPAGAEPVRLARHPCASRPGFHTLTTRIWSLFQFPPKPELAAAASLPLLLLTIILLRAPGAGAGPPRLCRAGRQVRPAAAGAAGLAALAGAALALLVLAHAAVPALRGPVQLGLLARRLAAASRPIRSPCTTCASPSSSSARPSRRSEHLPARDAGRDPGCAAGAADRLHRGAPRRRRATACCPSSPPRRWRFPASCWASGCSSPTPARRSRSTARCGSC